MSNPDNLITPIVFGIGGTALTAAERDLFKQTNPFGFILFKRNCETSEQIQWLIKELRYVVGRDDIEILIDQEGGRVSRLQAPLWAQYPAARVFGAMYEHDANWGVRAMHLYARLVAHQLYQLGITMNCAPVLDLLIDDASKAIGDRALSRKPAVVAALARTLCETFMSHGILPVIKHLPGHGRVTLDPHDLLPTITANLAELESDDFVPFELLKDIPVGMNSHAVFKEIDPDYPASLSPVIYEEVIRGRLGFDGRASIDNRPCCTRE